MDGVYEGYNGSICHVPGDALLPGLTAVGRAVRMAHGLRFDRGVNTVAFAR